MDDFSRRLPEPAHAGLPDAAARLLACNAVTARYGLRLTETDAAALATAHARALQSTGRVSFMGGALEALMLAFCDSPYLDQDSYADTMAELTLAFYAFKNEALDELDDAEAIALMKRLFDGPYCEGSLDRLTEELLPEAARRVRAGLPPEPEDNGGRSEEEYDE
jgi:hypothetical protein